MRSQSENDYFIKLNQHLADLLSKKKKSPREIVEDFSTYVPRQVLSNFLVRHELFKQVLNVKGSIIEGGVFRGAGLMSWAQFSAIFEPVNYRREIIGFDTFAGFPEVSVKDKGFQKNIQAHKGGFAFDSYSELSEAIKLYDANRFLSHISKIKLVKGDFMKTGPAFLKNNQHTLVSLLYLDFDIYAPTKEALKLFLPRMPRGSVVAFHEVNNSNWPGETIALLEEMNLQNYALQQFYYEPNIAYVVL